MKKWLTLLLLIFLLFPQPAYAHAFGQSYNLPIPFWLYAYGSAGALLMSFVIVGYFLSGKNEEKKYPSRDISRSIIIKFLQSPFVINAVQIISVLLFLLIIISGLVGVDDSYRNFNMTFFWVILVLGLTYFTAFVGNIYPTISPWIIMTAWYEKIMGVEGGSIKYPKKLSYWPALLFYFLFIWVELLGELGPANLSIILLIYSFLMVLGVFIFGSQKWFVYGDFFGLFFKLIGMIAPVQYVKGKLKLTLPFASILNAPKIKSYSLLIFILFALSSTAYDGFSESTPWYQFYWGSLYSLVNPLFGDFSHTLVGSLGLIISPFFFLAIFTFCIYLSRILSASRMSVTELGFSFGYSLIPIVLAYNIAHYYTLLITQGQRIFSLLSDPFGFGWNLFRTADLNLNYIPDVGFIWHSQVALILIGHIISVYLAHVVALSVFPSKSRAVISQIPILVLMMLYTVIGLWILSSPLGSV